MFRRKIYRTLGSLIVTLGFYLQVGGKEVAFVRKICLCLVSFQHMRMLWFSLKQPPQVPPVQDSTDNSLLCVVVTGPSDPSKAVTHHYISIFILLRFRKKICRTLGPLIVTLGIYQQAGGKEVAFIRKICLCLFSFQHMRML